MAARPGGKSLGALYLMMGPIDNSGDESLVLQRGEWEAKIRIQWTEHGAVLSGLRQLFRWLRSLANTLEAFVDGLTLIFHDCERPGNLWHPWTK